MVDGQFCVWCKKKKVIEATAYKHHCRAAWLHRWKDYSQVLGQFDFLRFGAQVFVEHLTFLPCADI